MGELINLRAVRKAKKRREDEGRAGANRMKHGRSKAEKRLAAMDKQKHDAVIDGARREPADIESGHPVQLFKNEPTFEG